MNCKNEREALVDFDEVIKALDDLFWLAHNRMTQDDYARFRAVISSIAAKNTAQRRIRAEAVREFGAQCYVELKEIANDPDCANPKYITMMADAVLGDANRHADKLEKGATNDPA